MAVPSQQHTRSPFRTAVRRALIALIATLVPATLALAAAPAAVAAALLNVATVAPTAPFPYDQTFGLHSDPDSTKIIYLDFVGFSNSTETDTPYDTDGVPGQFSDSEMNVVQDVWARVSENYAAFDVDVTTEDPGAAALHAGSGATSGVRVIITDGGSGGLEDNCTGFCVGLGEVGAWGQVDPAAIVIATRLEEAGSQGIAEVTTHEVGHTLGLRHDVSSASSSLWSPVMSPSYHAAPIMQWTSTPLHAGVSGGDELATIEQTLPPKSDGFGQSSTQATALPGTSFDVAGTISASTQTDWFSFTVPDGYGPLSLDVAPSEYTSMLDIDATLFDSSLDIVQDSDPPAVEVDSATATGLDAPFTNVSLAPGTYYLRVEGSGGSGYTAYGSIGTYTIVGGLAPPPQCPAGSYSTTGVAPCTPAPAGSSATGPGATSAIPCAPGSFSATAGASTCATTPAGSFNAGTGNTAATPCPSGSTSPSGASGCEATSLTLAYTGPLRVSAGSGLTVSASLTSSAAVCQVGQSAVFSLSADPTTGTVGSYPLGTGTSTSTGLVSSPPISTAGWKSGSYVVTVSSPGGTAGPVTCPAAAGTATLVVGSPRTISYGAGQYTVPGVGPIVFGFAVDSAASGTQTVRGSVEVVAPHHWLLEGTVNGYRALGTTSGQLTGTGSLFWWNPVLRSGSGDWQLAARGQRFTATAIGPTGSGAASFGLAIPYTPVGRQPATLPNSAPQVLLRGTVVIGSPG